MTTNTSAATSFINIGERTNVTGSAKFRKLIEANDYAAALGDRALAGRERRADPRRQHGRGPARFREGDGDVPQPDRRRARHRPRARDDRQLQVERDRGGPQVRAGQADRQLHQHEGGRGGVPRPRQEVPALRGRRGGDGIRRKGPGRHYRAQGRDQRARLQAADREGRLPARGHHLRPQHLRRRHRHRGAQRLRARLHRGDAPDQGQAAARACFRAAFPTCRSPSAATRPCGRRCTRCSCTTPLPPASTWRSSTPARSPSTTTSSPSCASCART